MNRREFVASSAALAAAPVNAAPAAPGLSMNEDSSHYFFTRAGQKLDAAKVASWVDQYAGTQVRELILNPNAQRTSYDSKVRDPIWRGYDPDGPDDQPLLASLTPEGRKGARKWIHTAWQLAHDGIDVYKVWIARAREKRLSPWISMRMNDLHNVDDERCYIHNEFWRSHPQFRRVPYRGDRWIDRALDYAHPEVREHNMALVRELAERYDFDGLELDWMRFGYHFRPGQEAQGAVILTRFTRDVRRLLDQWEKKRKHRIRLAARVPSRPRTAEGLGMDGVRWAHEGLIDMLVITPFWATLEFDMPIEEWKQLLAGTKVTLAAGLELLIRPYSQYSKPSIFNSLETVRGAAASLLDRGADRIYLFNYMDSDTAIPELATYPTLLGEVGSLQTIADKHRRHVITYADTWAPGEPVARNGLPAQCVPKRWHEFRIPTGPKPASSQVTAVLGIEGAKEDIGAWDLRVNGEPCAFTGEVTAQQSKPSYPLYGFRVPPAAMNRGYNLIEVQPKSAGTIHWVEISIG